jgi:hypothetical protein
VCEPYVYLKVVLMCILTLCVPGSPEVIVEVEKCK